MSSVELQSGFNIWREEVYARESLVDQSSVPYVALLPLVGIYRAVHEGITAELKSFRWRQGVLNCTNAMNGLKREVSRFADDLDDTFELPVMDILTEAPASLQAKKEQESIRDGLPTNIMMINWNELFLARHLGFAVHDDAAYLRPLRLTDQGESSVRHHYPTTAAYLEDMYENSRH